MVIYTLCMLIDFPNKDKNININIDINHSLWICTNAHVDTTTKPTRYPKCQPTYKHSPKHPSSLRDSKNKLLQDNYM